MKDWTPEQWAIFFTAAGGFATTISIAVVALVKALAAKASADANNSAINQMSSQAQQMQSKITDIALAQSPMPADLLERIKKTLEEK